MKYRKNEAKEYAKTALKGVWTALPTNFTADDKLDEKGNAANLEHCISKLNLEGLLIDGFQKARSQDIVNLYCCANEVINLFLIKQLHGNLVDLRDTESANHTNLREAAVAESLRMDLPI